MSASDKNKVGYKKPPLHSRFQPGHSGNPRGRPKKAASVGHELVVELDRKVTVRENGVEQTMPKAAALAKSLVARALAGDMRAVGHLVRLLPAQFQAPPEDTPDAALDAADAAALERFVARRLAMIKAAASPTNKETSDTSKDDSHE
jgi:hypothetical protein